MAKACSILTRFAPKPLYPRLTSIRSQTFPTRSFIKRKRSGQNERVGSTDRGNGFFRCWCSSSVSAIFERILFMIQVTRTREAAAKFRFEHTASGTHSYFMNSSANKRWKIEYGMSRAIYRKAFTLRSLGLKK